MSRKNFMHQADLLFFNADGYSNYSASSTPISTTFKPTISNPPILEPDRPVVNTTNGIKKDFILSGYTSSPVDLEPKPIVDGGTTRTTYTKRPIVEDVFNKPTYTPPIIEEIKPSLSGVQEEKPIIFTEQPRPIYTPPIIEEIKPSPTVFQEEKPIVVSEQPRPQQPIIPIVNQIITETMPSSATFPSLPSYGGSVSQKPVSSGGGSPVEVKKSWIPLILALGGLAIIVLKPLKQ